MAVQYCTIIVYRIVIQYMMQKLQYLKQDCYIVIQYIHVFGKKVDYKMFFINLQKCIEQQTFNLHLVSLPSGLH